MHQCLCGQPSSCEVRGIVNGTTNFMLTKMVQEGMGFEEALADCPEPGLRRDQGPLRRRGRPGRRPQDRHPGLAWPSGGRCYTENLPTRGIRPITAADVKRGRGRLGCAIKLIAWCRQAQDGAV